MAPVAGHSVVQARTNSGSSCVSVHIHDQTLLLTRTNSSCPCGPLCLHLDLTSVSTKVICLHEILDIGHIYTPKYPIWIEHHTYFLPISVHTRIFIVSLSKWPAFVDSCLFHLLSWKFHPSNAVILNVCLFCTWLSSHSCDKTELATSNPVMKGSILVLAQQTPLVRVQIHYDMIQVLPNIYLILQHAW